MPLQEFKTNCFVTRDHGRSKVSAIDSHTSSLLITTDELVLESPYLQAQAVLNPGPYYNQSGVQGNPGQLPVLTCFLPSLPRDTPFRVSVHSWNRPRPTRVMEGLMQPEDLVMFEVRIFIDGICASYVAPEWPPLVLSALTLILTVDGIGQVCSTSKPSGLMSLVSSAFDSGTGF